MKPFIRAIPLALLAALPLYAADKPAAAHAAPVPPSPTLSEWGHALKNALTEEETRLLMEYVRDSVMAGFNDEQVTLPPDLAFKLEVLTQRMKKQSTYYLDNLIKQMEEDISRALKEKMKPAPPVPYELPAVQLLPVTPAPQAAPAHAPSPIPSPTPSPMMPNPYLPPAWIYTPPPLQTAPPPVPYTWPVIPWFTNPTPAPIPAPNECPNCPSTAKKM